MKNDVIIPGSTIGILGAGQLGKMSLIAAHRLGYHTAVYAPEGDIPAMEMATHRLTYGWDDLTGIAKLVDTCDVITTEWENAPLSLIKELEHLGAIVRPGSKVLEVAQSRIKEKMTASELGIPTAPTLYFAKDDEVSRDYSTYLPGRVKHNKEGYDGKGQYPVDTTEDISQALDTAGVDCVLEKHINLLCELSVLVARTADGRMEVSEVVENAHKDGILDVTTYPTSTGDMMLMRGLREQAREYAKAFAEHLELEGVLCLEFFVDEEYNLLFNEMAPRPHNSFHGSIEAARTCQFEQHIRAVCGLPLGQVSFHSHFTMTNLIGGSWEEDWSGILSDPLSRLHLYGKAASRPGRKMGHVTRLKMRGPLHG